MQVKNLKGRKCSIQISKYLVDWDAKCCSKYQKEIQDFFRPYWETHICGAEVRIPSSLYRFDLVNFTRKIICEASHNQHRKYSKLFHGGNRMNFLSSLNRDLIKSKWAEDNNFKLIEIFPEDLPKLSRKWIMDTYQIDII